MSSFPAEETSNITNASSLDFPQQVALTSVIAASNVLFFCISILFYVFHFRNCLRVGRRRQLPYVNLSIFGMMILSHDQTCNIWTWDLDGENDLGLRALWIFYVIGFPAVITPVAVRSWRVICLYLQTPNINCTMSNPFTIMRRATVWMLLRISILMAPFCVLYPFIFLSTKIDYGILPLQLLILTANLIFTLLHCTLRKQLKEKDLSEVNSLFIFSISLYIYFIYDNVMYYYVMDKVDSIFWPVLGYIIIIHFMFWSLCFGSIWAIARRSAKKTAGDLNTSFSYIKTQASMRLSNASPRSARFNSTTTAMTGSATPQTPLSPMSTTSAITQQSSTFVLSTNVENTTEESPKQELEEENATKLDIETSPVPSGTPSEPTAKPQESTEQSTSEVATEQL